MLTDVTPDELHDVASPGHAPNYVADASDLRGKFDAARGLTVRSANGNRVVYWVKLVHVDNEGDVLWWELVAWSKGYPPITVFND